MIETGLQLAGRLHPVLLHLPIGALAALLFVEAWARLRRRPADDGVRRLLIVFTALTAALSAGSGWLLAEEPAYGGAPLELHRKLGIALASATTLAALAALLGWRRIYTGLLLVSLGLLVPTGHLGGTMTHGDDFLTEPLRGAAPGASPPAPADGETSHVLASTGTDGAAGDTIAGSRTSPAATGDAAAAPGWYATRIAPILDARCGACHGTRRQRGGLALHTQQALLAGGESGPVIVPGDAAASELLRRLRLPPDDDDHMPPPSKPQPTAAEIDALERWIAAGASTGAIAAAPPSGAGATLPETAYVGRSDPAIDVAPPDPAAVARLRARHVHAEVLDPETGLLWLDYAALPATTQEDLTGDLPELMSSIGELSLAGTAIDDDALLLIGCLPFLEDLDLSRTGVTSAGIPELAACTKLVSLNLTGTAVDDDAVDALAALPGLAHVYLWDTGVTAAGLMQLAELRPGLVIEAGDDLAAAPQQTEPEPLLGAPATLAPVNTLCPVSGAAIDPAFRLVHDDAVVGFCCADCVSEFLADPSAFTTGS